MHVKRKSIGKLNAVEHSPSNPMPEENTSNATTIGKMDEVKDLEEAYNVQHDEVDLHNVTIDPDLDKTYVDSVTVTHHTEAYTVLHVPVDGQYTGSVCVKVGHWSW